MYEDIVTILIGSGILFAITGSYFAIKAWVLWTRTSDDIIRGRAFLNRQFLYRNFILVFIVGFLVAAHLFLELIDIYGLPLGLEMHRQQIGMFHILLLTASMLLLIFLAYYWCRLLSPLK